MQTAQKDEGMTNANDETVSIKEINEESTNKPSDETMREVLRGEESKGDANERDVVGAVESIDTPQGREEAKKDIGGDS